jgi:hypothetical protein
MFVTSQVAVRYALRAPLRQLDVYNTTECLFFFVCLFCMQIYSFTSILMKFCTLDFQNKRKITVYFNFTKTDLY